MRTLSLCCNCHSCPVSPGKSSTVPHLVIELSTADINQLPILVRVAFPHTLPAIVAVIPQCQFCLLTFLEVFMQQRVVWFVSLRVLLANAHLDCKNFCLVSSLVAQNAVQSGVVILVVWSKIPQQVHIHSVFVVPRLNRITFSHRPAQFG